MSRSTRLESARAAFLIFRSMLSATHQSCRPKRMRAGRRTRTRTGPTHAHSTPLRIDAHLEPTRMRTARPRDL
jgi:hypothetical protein